MRPSRTGGTVPPGNHTPAQAPILSSPNPSEIDWIWTYPNPVTWNEWESADGVTGWFIVNSQPGSARNDTGVDSGYYCYIQGVDGSGNPVTGQSNVVQIM